MFFRIVKPGFTVSHAGAFVAALTLLSNGAALAQTSPSAGDQSALVQQLLNKIDALEASQRQMQDQLDKLQGSGPAQAPAVPKTQLVPSSAPVAEATPQPQVVSVMTHVLGPVQFRGFSDLDFGRAWFEKQPPGGLKGSTNSFNVGDFDLFTNTQLSDHWSMLGEMLVTSDSSNEFGVEMDRLLLTYKHNDHFKISIGKYATSLGYFTNEFHRAQYFQTSIGRPIMYSDEDNGGMLPVHNIGVSATGTVFSPVLGLHWVAELANGRSSLIPDIPVQNFQDDNNGKAVNLALYARPEGMEGMQAGFSFYRSTLHPAGFPAVSQTIYTGHVAFSGDKLEWLNEGSMLRHTLHGNNRVFHDFTSYTQLAYRFGKLRPYFRYDYQNASKDDPVYSSFGRSNGPSVGVSRRLSNYVVFKVQYGRLAVRGETSTNALQSQMAFAF